MVENYIQLVNNMTNLLSLRSSVVHNLCHSYLTDLEGQQRTFNIINYNFKPVSADLSGFFGYHHFLIVDVAIKDRDNEEQKQLRFFAKSAPIEIESRMKYLQQFGVFEKEKTVFSDVLPKLEGIFPNLTPKCYYADDTLLIFEDLNLLQYKMAAARDGLLDYKHLKCTVKTLAAMHAASVVYELDEKKNLKELFPQACQENAYPLHLNQDHMRYQNFHNALNVFKEFIKLMPKYRSNLEEVLENLQPQMAKIYTLAQTSDKYLNVFSHGDMWANNVMFKYDEEDGITPILARFVDFQLARYAPPILDLITILTIPTTREFRSTYLMVLLTDYYTFLAEFLLQKNLLIEDFLTREQFKESFEEYRICGLIESCFFSHLTILPPDSTKSLTESADGFTDFFQRKRVEICLKAFQSDIIYRERLTDMLEDLVDNYILK